MRKSSFVCVFLRLLKFKVLGISIAALGAALGSSVAWAVPPASGCGLAGNGPGSEFFNNDIQMIMSVGGLGGTGLALSVSESSTTQILELIGRRRLEESCPSGAVRVGGACVLQAATVPKAAKTGPKAKQPIAATIDEPPLPELAEKKYGVWTEVYADYEEHTKTKQKQTTTGGVLGIDRTFRNGNSGVQLGLFGAYSKIEQRSRFSGTQKEVPTEYTVDFSNNQNFEGIGTVKYVLPVDHTIESSTRQSLDGLSIGASASFFGGGWFSDLVAKVDFFDVTGVTKGTDKFAQMSAMRPVFVQSKDGNGNPINEKGCLSTGFGVPFTRVEDFLAAPELKLFDSNEVTTLQNYIVANTFGYRFDLKNGFFWEPSATVRFTYSDYGSNADKLGLRDGHALRLEAGAKIGGAQILPDRSIWSYGVGAYVYSDVLVDGFVIAGAGGSSFEDDEGNVRFRGVLQSQLQLKDGFLVYGEIGGRIGQDYWGAGGKLGARVEW